MRWIILPLLFGLVALPLLARPTVCGALLGHESFTNYGAGDELDGLAGGLGWTDPWFAETFVTVENETLVFNGQSGAPNAALITGSDALHVMSRPFTSVDDTLYLGLLVRSDNWDDDFIQLQVSDGETGNNAETMTVGLDGRDPVGFYTRTGTSGQGSSFSIDAIHESDTDYFLVGKFSKDGSDFYNRVDLFVDPTGVSEPADPDATREGVETILEELSLFTVRTALMEGDEQIYLDEIRVGTTFADVTLQDADLPDPGDFNDDGVVNRQDFDILKTNFKEAGDFSMGDMNFDGFVDLHDFGEFAPIFNAANPGQQLLVPEPSSLALVGLGSFLLLSVLRRR